MRTSMLALIASAALLCAPFSHAEKSPIKTLSVSQLVQMVLGIQGSGESTRGIDGTGGKPTRGIDGTGGKPTRGIDGTGG